MFYIMVVRDRLKSGDPPFNSNLNWWRNNLGINQLREGFVKKWGEVKGVVALGYYKSGVSANDFLPEPTKLVVKPT